MIAHILVFVASLFIGYACIYPVLRPLIIRKQSLTSAEIISAIIVDTFIIAIDIGLILLVFYKFNNTFWTCIGAHISALVYVIIDCNRDKKHS